MSYFRREPRSVVLLHKGENHFDRGNSSSRGEVMSVADKRAGVVDSKTRKTLGQLARKTPVSGSRAAINQTGLRKWKNRAGDTADSSRFWRPPFEPVRHSIAGLRTACGRSAGHDDGVEGR